MAFRFVLKEYVCRQCKEHHILAVRVYHCGRLDPGGSPNTNLCYGCQLKQVSPAILPILLERYRLLWKVAASDKPLPPELAD